MFNACYSLKSIPAFNTALVTTMASMFSGCTQIESVPLFNTALVTSMASMFQNCYRLQSVPLFNTAAVTAMNSMFTFCQSLRGIPLFNTSLVNTMASMFTNCSFLRTVPLLDTSSVTTVNAMFSGCTSLSSIPALVVTSVSSSSNFTNFVLNCNSNGRVQAKNFRFSFSLTGNRLSKTALEEVFSNLPTVTTSQTLTITSNYGVGTLTTKTANLTLRSSTISLSDTSGLSTGMILHSGTGTGITTGISATSSTTADTLTYTSHGLSNGTVVSFSSIGTTTGISTWTPYYVVNSTADTFQVSLTLNGAAIDLTGSNGTVVVKYANYITSINPNVSITLSTPCASTASNSSLSFRTLDTANALLKNWALVL
jgi:surface protein